MLTGESSSKADDRVENRRAGFVESLLNANDTSSTPVIDDTNRFTETLNDTHVEETNDLYGAIADPIIGSMFLIIACVYSMANLVVIFHAVVVACCNETSNIVCLLSQKVNFNYFILQVNLHD